MARSGGAANVWGASSHIAHTEDVTMSNYDLSPFYRSTVGFDRLFSMLDRVGRRRAERADLPAL